ncbi:MAG: hypothetical protein A3J24_06640 [Deltaproteobacteria bacterium RIFCSPLOWO2_02_FULL_53_8]|nr:MAG: hypothetical protein A3J24_06640 [Deltaproteobacteria bacterium RIFCSPLOWO2_02_FULL_53_8]
MHTIISRDQLKTLLNRSEELVLVNSLSTEEFEHEHIPGSINIPADEIERLASSLLKEDDLIVVYSSSPRCMISAVAADKLTTIGYENVLRFSGGITEWEAAGFPVEQGYSARGKAA